MGICFSSDRVDVGVEQRKRSQMIDKGLEEDLKRLRKEQRMLLLGPGGGGKSTILKQMKIIYQNGYSEAELATYRLTVYKNVMESAKALIEAMHHFDLEPSSVKVREFMEFLMLHNIDPNTPLDPKVGEAVTYLWNDPCTSQVLEHQNEFDLMESAPYFFDGVKRIAAPDYIPNLSDVLRARKMTGGICETSFSMGQLSIRMFDISRGRGQRKKWIHCFDNVTSVIFCVALSTYDQVLSEDSNQNQMTESLVLFDSVVNSRWFVRTSIILFLNKVDLFKQKLLCSPFSNYFPDYSGGNDVNQAAKYLLSRFNQANRASLNLYSYLTQATDTSNVRLVFAAIKETIVQNYLKDSDIL